MSQFSLSSGPDSYFFSWATYLPYCGHLPKVMDYKSATLFRLSREVKEMTREESEALLLSELRRATDIIGYAQSSLISLVSECNRLRAENDFMLRLINKHHIGED